MAKQTIPIQQLARAGAAPTFTAATQTDLQFSNDGTIILELKNTNGASRTVTVATPGTMDGLAIADSTATLGATTGDLIFKPFPPQIYNQSDDYVYVDLTAFANVTVAAYRP